MLQTLIQNAYDMVIRKRVINRLALAPALYQRSLLQDSELVGDRRLGHGKGLGDIADTHFPVEQYTEDPYPGTVAEDLEKVGQIEKLLLGRYFVIQLFYKSHMLPKPGMILTAAIGQVFFGKGSFHFRSHSIRICGIKLVHMNNYSYVVFNIYPPDTCVKRVYGYYIRYLFSRHEPVYFLLDRIAVIAGRFKSFDPVGSVAPEPADNLPGHFLNAL